MKLEEYIDNINQRYKLGNATEHTFRGDLQQLIESLVPEIRATKTNERADKNSPDKNTKTPKRAKSKRQEVKTFLLAQAGLSH